MFSFDSSTLPFLNTLHVHVSMHYLYTQVLQIRLEECANFTDCESCISYNNPLCGWCTVENKCSRRSQCQNAVEPVRWVQNSSQCISTTITHSQFVLDDPEIVSVFFLFLCAIIQLNVTVTPRLLPDCISILHVCVQSYS